jgi:hypothetical protein
MSGPYRIRFHSLLRRSPDVAPWHGARDVSQRAEPDVRPLGCAVSAFIADKARCLSIPLAGDVPPQHLMSPIHSTGRRCVASAFNEPCSFRRQAMTSPFRWRHACPFRWQVVRPYCRVHYAHTAACTTPIMTRVLPRKQLRHINTVWTMDIMALGDRPGVTGVSYFVPFCPWAHMSGLSILVCAPLEL